MFQNMHANKCNWLRLRSHCLTEPIWFLQDHLTIWRKRSMILSSTSKRGSHVCVNEKCWCCISRSWTKAVSFLLQHSSAVWLPPVCYDPCYSVLGSHLDYQVHNPHVHFTLWFAHTHPLPIPPAHHADTRVYWCMEFLLHLLFLSCCQ
jgi:hypothetical protein